ncbi:MAG: hypothetical protein H7Z40_19135 [Phycisphaerae bacterium]|nr:hypothetical protein [Gemmatimonadaceae bacterium]
MATSSTLRNVLGGIVLLLTVFAVATSVFYLPRRFPTGAYRETSGIVEGSSPVFQSRVKANTATYAYVRLANGEVVLASVQWNRPVTKGTTVTLHDYARSNGRHEYVVVRAHRQ